MQIAHEAEYNKQWKTTCIHYRWKALQWHILYIHNFQLYLVTYTKIILIRW